MTLFRSFFLINTYILLNKTTFLTVFDKYYVARLLLPKRLSRSIVLLLFRRIKKWCYVVIISRGNVRRG
jgi:hypothetical protein